MLIPYSPPLNTHDVAVRVGAKDEDTNAYHTSSCHPTSYFVFDASGRNIILHTTLLFIISIRLALVRMEIAQ